MATNSLYEYVEHNAPVIENYIQTLGVHGEQPQGGLIRPVYSPAWQTAQKQVEAWLTEAGLSTRRDAIGNLWGRLEGREPGPAIVSGSHLDTVRLGGKYDGALGVIAALSAARFLKELYGPPRRTLDVVVLCEEEGSRFTSSFLGSRAIIGDLPLDEIAASQDADGISVVEAAKEAGFDATQVAGVRRDDIDTFIELHIEQGAIMEQAGVPIGIVHVITGLQHLEVTFTGRADHAGTTPMDLRTDPLVAAADAIGRINRVARELGRPAVATVGVISVESGARNIVPGQASFDIDFRHSDPAIKAQMAERIRQVCHEAAQAQGVTVDFRLLMEHPPARMTPAIVELLTASAAKLGFTSMPMVSGAGHDSQVMVERFPTAMIFVPSVGGRSHSAAEFTPIEQVVPGVAVLAQALYDLAYA